MTAEVEAANTALYEALESADVDRMARVWDEVEPDALVCVHPGWPMLRGRAHVLRSFSAIMANTPYIQFFLTDVEVELAGDVAVLTCVENILTAMDPNNPAADDSSFAGAKAVATNVFCRTSTGWRLWVHHGSPVMGSRAPKDEDDDQDPDDV